jgi:hypothetical protein
MSTSNFEGWSAIVAKDRINDETEWAAVAARAQAYLALQHAELQGLAERAKFLMTLGLSRSEAAGLLRTTDDSLRHVLDRAAKKPQAKGTKEAAG